MPWARDACPKAMPSLRFLVDLLRLGASVVASFCVLPRDFPEAPFHSKNRKFLLAQGVRELNPRGSPEASPEASPGTSPEAFPKSNFIRKIYIR